MLKKITRHHVISATALGGIVIAAFSFGGAPLFDTTDDFVLFAQTEVKLEQGVQVSSGDIGSNNKLTVGKAALLTSNLFADRITLDKGTVVNGNASFNAFQTKKDTQVGATTTPVSIPIADLPGVPSFQTGTQDLIFRGENNTLNAGSFDAITLEKNSRLLLTGGTYNITKLTLKESATIIFAATTILNIEQELMGQQNIAVLPGADTTPDGLTINYKGTKGQQKGQGTAPIHFGNNSFLNFILIAPNAAVNIGERSTIRGQILANKIMVGKDSILSRETAFVKESDPEKVVTDTDGSVFIVNEIMVNFVDSATFVDAQAVADLIDGRVVGFIELMNTYQIEVTTVTTGELETKIQAIRDLNNSLIEGVFRNYVLGLF